MFLFWICSTTLVLSLNHYNKIFPIEHLGVDSSSTNKQTCVNKKVIIWVITIWDTHFYKGEVFFSLVHTKNLTIENFKVEIDVKKS